MGDCDDSIPDDQSKKGWLTSIHELGAWVGTLLSGFVAEYLSRKRGIMIATCVFIVGVVIQTTAVSGVYHFSQQVNGLLAH
jgi:sugar phosphate permease